VAGASFLLSSDAALLADEMGLGKTVQTAAAISLARETIGRILLVVPSSLCLNWLRELSSWAPDIIARRVIGSAEDRLATYKLPIKLLIVSFEQLREDYHQISADSQFDLVIVDEAQRIKNSSSEMSLACRIIPKKRSWALTGTPVENRPEDLISIFRFIYPGLLRRGMTHSEIHELIRSHFLRRTKRDVLSELPPIIYKDLHLELNRQQQQAYDDIWEQRYNLAKDKDSLSPANMLAVITPCGQNIGLRLLSLRSRI
jgi:SNF2 family DNA or RNA helicase